MTHLSFTSAPGPITSYKVGDAVEVYCDHENAAGDRTRDWLEGIIVQVDPKIVAVQFEESVYLTDGWMIPDHVLWCPHKSTQIRPVRKKKKRPRKIKLIRH